MDDWIVILSRYILEGILLEMYGLGLFLLKIVICFFLNRILFYDDL